MSALMTKPSCGPCSRVRQRSSRCRRWRSGRFPHSAWPRARRSPASVSTPKPAPEDRQGCTGFSWGSGHSTLPCSSIFWPWPLRLASRVPEPRSGNQSGGSAGPDRRRGAGIVHLCRFRGLRLASCGRRTGTGRARRFRGGGDPDRHLRRSREARRRTFRRPSDCANWPGKPMSGTRRSLPFAARPSLCSI